MMRYLIGAAAAPLACLALAACANMPDEGFAMVPRAETPRFDPVVFFAGRTEGVGVLDKGLLGSVPVQVESVGVVAPDGVLVVTQTILEDDGEPRTRAWTLTRIGENTYEGRLDDAFGPVEGWTSGNMLTLTYTLHGNYEVTQRLTLAPDGQRATNAMRVELLGATVAVLTEDIVRVGEASDQPAPATPHSRNTPSMRFRTP